MYIQESAENGEDFDGKWRDALMWKFFLKQTYLFSVFRVMSEDGGGGGSKVS